MIVAVICDVLGEENNGTTIGAMNLIRTCGPRGHQVRVVSPDANRVGGRGITWSPLEIWGFSTTMWQKRPAEIEIEAIACLRPSPVARCLSFPILRAVPPGISP